MGLPPKLVPGDQIRVLALSRSLQGVMQQGGLTENDVAFATHALESLGLKVTFGRWVRECNEHLTTSIQHRLEDFHEALGDPAVMAILAVSGGVGAIQLLDGIDYRLVAAQPKILCGYSDVAYLGNAIYARAGVVTYYGPNFTTFMMRRGNDYTIANFRACLFGHAPIILRPADQWSDDAWHKDQEHRGFYANDGFWPVQEGETEGVIIGGSSWCLNMLQGSAYSPPLRDALLFLEQPAEGKATLMALDSGLRSLAFQPEFGGVRAIVLGRYARSGGVTRENLTKLLRQFPALQRLPVVANCDFGHTTPIGTIPIGGKAKLTVRDDRVTIELMEH